MKFNPSEDDIKKIIDMKEIDKMSSTSIGKIYGVSQGPILRILRESGVVLKGSHKKTFTKEQVEYIIKELLYNNANYFLSRKYEKMPSGD